MFNCGVGGDLVHDLKIAKTNFIRSELERRKSELQTHLVWIGAQKDPGLTARLWKWVNGKVCLIERGITKNISLKLMD